MLLTSVLSLLAGIVMDWQAAMLFIEGVSTLEDLSEDTTQQYQSLLEHPLDLNNASTATLLASGLLTDYQVATLQDYIQAHGAVASYTELSAINGFGANFASALRPFTVLLVRSLMPEHPHIRTAGTLRSGATVSVPHPKRNLAAIDPAQAFSGKVSVTGGTRWAVCLGATADASGKPLLLSARFYSARYATTFYAGSFNARFGQGLSQWNGINMTTLKTANQVLRSASGITIATSYHGANSHFGIAHSTDSGPWSFHSYLARSPGANGLFCMGHQTIFRSGRGTYGAGFLLPLAALRPLPRSLSSAPATPLQLSAYCKFTTASSITFATELAWAYGPAFSSALMWSPAYQTALTAQVRMISASYVPLAASPLTSYSAGKDELSLLLGFCQPGFSVTFDSALRPQSGKAKVRALLTWTPILPLPHGAWSLKPSVRLSLQNSITGLPVVSSFGELPVLVEALRQGAGSTARNDLRLSLAAVHEKFTASLRSDFISTQGLISSLFPSASQQGSEHLPVSWHLGMDASFMGSVELKKTVDYKVGATLGMFVTDGWDGRVYVYMRDIPGNLTVPALYGSGYYLNAYLKLGSFTLAVSQIDYPWSAASSKLSAKISYAFRFTHKKA